MKLQSVVIILWIALLAFLIGIMVTICDNNYQLNLNSTTSAVENLDNADKVESMNNTFDYTENFEPHDATPDIGDNAAPRNEVSNQDVNFDVPIENQDTLRQNVDSELEPAAGEVDENDVLNVDASELLIAAAADRFYSIDTKVKLIETQVTI